MRLLSCTIVALCSPLAAAQAHFNIIIVAGQSNARPAFAQGIYSELLASPTLTNPWLFHRHHSGNRMDRWVGGAAPNHTLGPNFLADFWNPEGTAGLQSFVETIEAAGQTWEIAGFFWFQGEADTSNPAHADRYASRFFHMLNTIESEFGLDARIPFIITKIDYNGDDDALAQINRTPEDIEHIRDAQAWLGASVPWAAASDSRGWPRLDVWHVGDFLDPRGQYWPVFDLGAEQAHMFLSLPRPASRADLNADGVHDIADLIQFITWFRLSDPRADLAPPTGVHNLDDLAAFVTAFMGG